jgi:hypothetical protein
MLPGEVRVSQPVPPSTGTAGVLVQVAQKHPDAVLAEWHLSRGYQAVARQVELTAAE